MLRPSGRADSSRTVGAGAAAADVTVDAVSLCAVTARATTKGTRPCCGAPDEVPPGRPGVRGPAA
ncbi:hypothetical protein, partial [Streptomyces sp. SID486]|uniref:hypothetical protein n=1 Tax=Streptomyces sp. SID486 TaxID=2690264 RepID=UPI001F2AA19B